MSLSKCWCCLPLCKLGRNRRNGDEKEKEDISGKTCVICLETLKTWRKSVLVTQCRHTFHKHCLQRWGRTCRACHNDFSCPICREHVRTLKNARTRREVDIDLLLRPTNYRVVKDMLTGLVRYIDVDAENAAHDAVEERWGPMDRKDLDLKDFMSVEKADPRAGAPTPRRGL